MAQSIAVKMVAALVIGILIGVPGGWYWQQGTINEQQQRINELTAAIAQGEEALEEVKASLPLAVGDGEIRVLATVNGKYFTEPFQHAIVFKGGKNAGKALFVAEAFQNDFHDVLISLGAVPGNNVKLDSPEGTRVEGTIIDVYVTWEGAEKRYTLGEVISDPAGQGFLVKFGGNLDFQKNIAMTGCLLCLGSCAAGITSNSAYGWGEWPEFHARADVLPPDGAFVQIIFVPRL